MQHNKGRSDQKAKVSPKTLKYLLKMIGNLSRTGMQAGNNGDFDQAFSNMNEALDYTKELDKKCLEAKLLNNFGLLYTMQGAWDKAMLKYEQSLDIVVAHYGTSNILYRTLQKNILYLFKPA